MQASDAQLGPELSQTRVFVIPHFQRPYVWGAENWEDLWDDVREAAEGVEAEWLETSPPMRPYFLGAFVTQQRPAKPKRLSSSSVIDGQQRMTTLQVLLAAARQAAADRGVSTVADKLEDLIANSSKAVDPAHPEDIPKLVPLRHDQAAFAWATRAPGTTADRPLAGPLLSDRICDTREWFDDHIGRWAAEEGASPDRLDALHFALTERVQIVHIILDSTEDPKVIFEVLNGRGEPLSEADLIKNHLFERGEVDGATAEQLLDLWAPFDAKPWRDELTTGRVRRVFIDVFLTHWLSAATGKEPRVEDLFDDFKRWLAASGERAIDVVRRLRADGDKYVAMRAEGPGTSIGALVDTMEATSTTTPWPLVLGLSTRAGVPSSEVDVMASAIASFTMRRAICRLTTKDYNNLFLTLLNASKAAPASHAGQRVVTELASMDADSRRWPSDTEFMAGLLDANLYNNVYRARLRALLTGLENHLRTEKTEDQSPLSVRNGLQVEHLLPQRWQEHWPVDFNDHGAVAARQDAVHRLGNLTLLTQKLNGSISHGAWSKKAGEIGKHALLLLTTSSVFGTPPNLDQTLASTWKDGWDEERILARSVYLASEAVAAWPRPDGGAPAVDWRSKLVPPAAAV